MRLKLIIFIAVFLATFGIASAQTVPVITTGNPTVQATASKGFYYGQNCLIITLKDGKVPINVPEGRLKLFSGEENSFKSFILRQIAPGKFVTSEPIQIDEANFVLKITGSRRIKDINISFKTKPKEPPKPTETPKPPAAVKN